MEDAVKKAMEEHDRVEWLVMRAFMFEAWVELARGKSDAWLGDFTGRLHCRVGDIEKVAREAAVVLPVDDYAHALGAIDDYAELVRRRIGLAP